MASSSRPAARRLTLASGSPQRRAILERLSVPFSVCVAGVTELDVGEPEEVARENALRKARAVSARSGGGPVLGCDTLVALADQIYGKPADEHAARATLRALSGATHAVVGGLALVLDGQERTATARTAVSFRVLDEGLLDWYLATGEWRGRAGAYAIQGAGAALVRSVHGDYENVVGLPLAALLDLYPELLDDPER
ncbi:MAG TPA: Maf family protein [Solirubrobacteraceae bacterium]|nr:Maf family protein [Solirubrobacteraceae bacterium]